MPIQVPKTLSQPLIAIVVVWIIVTAVGMIVMDVLDAWDCARASVEAWDCNGGSVMAFDTEGCSVGTCDREGG